MSDDENKRKNSDTIAPMDDHRPLADILRPKTLDGVVGQVHLVGKNGILA